MIIKIFVIVALLAVLINCASAYRILCPYPANSRSHFIVAEALFKGLATKGHEVTVISAFPPEKPIPNYRHIKLDLVTNHDDFTKMFVKEPGDSGFSWDSITSLARLSTAESHSMLNNAEVQRIMAEETFDLVIMEFLGVLHIGLSAHFNCPAIFVISTRPFYSIFEMMGNPLGLSYARNLMYPWADLNRFTDRLINFSFYLFEKVITTYLDSKYRAFHIEHFPPTKYPSYDEILKNNVAAIFVAHHFTQGDVRPLVPGVIEIGGIQMSETASPLSDTLQPWMDQSTNGVIYFSLGTNAKVSSLSPDRLAAMFNVFKNLKQNILWKSDVATIPGAPTNVRFENWVSQIDVLHHKNTRLFITHGGLGSITESKFYGVPVLVIPMFGDQIANADIIVAEGWGIKLQYADFTTEKRLSESLAEVLGNPKYTERAKYESMLFRDRPQTPLQTAIYWTEYIIRNKGAHHMRSNATQLNWFQLHSLDVIGLLLAVLIIWAYISYRILKCLVKKIFGAKKIKLKTN